MIRYRCVCSGKEYNFTNISHCQGKKHRISVIIPTYNEEENIQRLIESIIQNLKCCDYEIVIIDDSSSDRTPEIIDTRARSNNIIALHRQGIRGIFSAIKDGIKLSSGNVIVIMDADFSHPPGVIPNLLKHIENFDIVSASRFVKNGRIIAPLKRKIGTTSLNKICRFILGIKTKDITGGFHAIDKQKFNSIYLKYDAIWGEFDMELFYRAGKMKFKIKEVPFIYHFRDYGTSKSQDLKYGLTYLLFTIKLRLFG